MQHVVVIGAGFAGMRVVRHLAKSPVHITLIDRTNHHLFQPLLYQVATGSLGAGEVAPPLRWVLRKQKNVRVCLGDVYDIDPSENIVRYSDVDGDDHEISYDHLIVATGASHSYFGNDQWEADAPGLKTMDDALELRRRIFAAFERADVAETDEGRKRHLTFVVVGAGPTGVEIAGQLIEIARRTLRREYRRFDPYEARTVLLDASPRVLGAFPEKLSAKAQKSLEDMGVEVRTGAMVTDVDSRSVELDGSERITAGTIIWAAGVQGSPLGELLAQRTGITLSSGRRVPVEADFSIKNHPEIRVLGDLADSGMPGVAPAAMQQGEWVAKSIDAFERRKSQPAPMRYKDRGSMATIGRRRAVAAFNGIKTSGTFAWAAWLFVHLMYVVGFANRVLVMVRWASSYLANGRGERALPRIEAMQTPIKLEREQYAAKQKDKLISSHPD